MKKITKLLVLTSLTASMMLTGCGGGSGGASTPVGGTTPLKCTAPQVLSNGACVTPAPTVTPAKLQTSVPTPTYLPGSEELAAFNEFNGFRKLMGLGLVAQNEKIDVAAKNHASYIVQNKIFAHEENSANTGFTGINPDDRMRFAGYAATYGGEELSTTGGLIGVRMLMNTIYHRDGIAFQFITDLGIAFNTGVQFGGGWVAPLVIDLGTTGGIMQNNASDFVTSYPVDGQTDLPLTMGAESPNPFTDIDATTNDVFTKTSSPISIYSAHGTTLAVSSFTVTEAGQTMPMEVRLITYANDINKHLGTNVVHIVGKTPFKSNTKFNVSFIGNVNGVGIVKNWSFSTGTSLNIGGGANK